MNVVAEFNSENAVRDILRHTKNLQGTRISVEYDLNEARQFNRKVMKELKNIILAKSKLHKVSVRNDKLRIENTWFHWNTYKVLCCVKSLDQQVILSLYGDSFNDVCFEYKELVNKINAKN